MISSSRFWRNKSSRLVWMKEEMIWSLCIECVENYRELWWFSCGSYYINTTFQAPNGVVSAQLYAELFAAYLYKNDLWVNLTCSLRNITEWPICPHFLSLLLFEYSCSARFLWKRIPPSAKMANAELEKIWIVFNYLWHNNISGFFKAINHEWSNNVAELMFELKGKQSSFFSIMLIDVVWHLNHCIGLKWTRLLNIICR